MLLGRRKTLRILILCFISFLLATTGETPEAERLIREYSPPGDMDALIENYSPDTPYLLVQLNLKFNL